MKDQGKHSHSVRMLFLFCLVLWSCRGLTQGQAVYEEIVQYTVQKPDKVQRGKEFQISVLFHVQPDWYIYAPTGTNVAQGMIETRVVFTLPKGITRAGKIKLPEPHFKDGYEVYKGKDITISQALQATPDLKAGRYEIKGKITWQSCNSNICLPPVTEEISLVVYLK